MFLEMFTILGALVGAAITLVSAQSVLFNASMNPLSVGLPGQEKSRVSLRG